MRKRLFQYAVLWHPTEKQVKEEGSESKELVPVTTILANTEAEASMQAAMSIDTEYKKEISQIEIVVRPF